MYEIYKIYKKKKYDDFGFQFIQIIFIEVTYIFYKKRQLAIIIM